MGDKETLLKEIIENILSYSLKDMLNDEMYVEVKRNVALKFKEFIVSEEIKSMIYKVAEDKITQIEREDKTFKDILPTGFENSFKVLVYNKSPEITQAITGFVNDVKFKRKIKEEISKFLSGMNPMVSKFINVENIYNKIMTSVLSYVQSQENIMNIVVMINNKIDEGSNKNISQYTNYIPYEGKMSFIKSFVDETLNILADDIFINTFEEKIENQILGYETVGKLLNSIGISEEKLFMRVSKSSISD